MRQKKRNKTNGICRFVMERAFTQNRLFKTLLILLIITLLFIRIFTWWQLLYIYNKRECVKCALNSDYIWGNSVSQLKCSVFMWLFFIAAEVSKSKQTIHANCIHTELLIANLNCNTQIHTNLDEMIFFYRF